MSFIRKNWKKKLIFLLIACVVYYLFIFLYITVSELNLNIYERIINAGNFAIVPYFLLQNVGGYALPFVILWFFYTFIYIYILVILEFENIDIV